MSKKFTDLPSKATAATSDLVAIWDNSAAVNKQTPVSGLASAVASSLPAASVKASNIDLTTLVLGLAEQTTSQTGISTTLTPLTGLSVSFTLASAQTVSFLGVANIVISSPPNSVQLLLKDGSTILQTARTDIGNGLGHIITIAYSVALAAGSHTITLNAQTDGGTAVTVNPVGTGFKTFLKVSLG